MVYLLDANVFITAKRDHYRFKTFPGFWKLLHSQGNATHRVESLVCVRKELEVQKDDLCAWVKTCPGAMFVPEANAKTAAAAPSVSTWATTHPTYTKAAVAEFLSVPDFWLVCHAMAHGHTVVTHEQSSPNSQKRVKLPDACNAMGVGWCTPWQMLEDMGASF